MTDPLFAPVGPVFSVNGALVPSMARDCVRLEIDEGVEGLRTLRLDLFGTGAGATGPPDRMIYLDGGVIDFGKQLTVCIGPDDGQRIAFDGTISAIEAQFEDGESPLVRIFAEDELMRLRMTRRMRSYTDVTDADLADTLAREHGLQSETDVDGPRYDVVQQLNQSDLAFLRERARLVQAELWCDGRTLHMSSRPRRSGTQLTLVQGNHLLSVRLCADLAHQRSEVHVTGYDASAKDVIDAQAGPDAIDAEVTGGRTGPRLVDIALGGSTTLRVRETPLNNAEASSWAAAEMLRRSRRFVCVAGTTRGSPDMVVGSRLTLQDVGAPFEGDGYYVTRVCHTVDLVRGLRTRFEAERATVNQVA
jgi:Bacteriophage probable baseplate hub protein